nr:peptidylprolyl isomerase [Campylobacter sp.]
PSLYKNGLITSPFLYNDGYLIAKVVDVLNPEPMSYENARAMVLKQYQQNLANQRLEELSKEALESKFAPKFTGYISKETQKPILGLNATEFNDFIDKLFKSKSKKGYFILGDKSIVYNILEQDLLDSSATGRYDELIIQNATAVKNEELQRDLLEILKNKYEYKQYKGIISGD